jgi:hypothetical protein
MGKACLLAQAVSYFTSPPLGWRGPWRFGLVQAVHFSLQKDRAALDRVEVGFRRDRSAFLVRADNDALARQRLMIANEMEKPFALFQQAFAVHKDRIAPAEQARIDASEVRGAIYFQSCERQRFAWRPCRKSVVHH